MKTNLVSVIGLALALVLAGCVSNAPMDVTRASRPSVLPADLHLPVRLSLKTATNEDVLAMAGSTYNVQSGKIFRQVFTGNEAAPAVLDLISSSIVQTSSDYMVLWQVVQVTYTVSASLKVGDRVQTISATGVAQTKWDPTDAAREAIEKAVLDLARQSQVLL